jgi:glutamate/tyrosine decarboxylase-like PLP-dependent enzyme
MSGPIWSGADPEEVRCDLAPLLDFREEGRELAEIGRLLEERLAPHLMRYDRATFQSMFNCRPGEGALFGAEWGLPWNQGVTNWQVSPGGALLEEMACEALADLLGLPGFGGTVMYCGSYANQQALYLALHHRAEQAGFDYPERGLPGFAGPERLTVLVSTDAHFSLRHAVRMLGLGEHGLVRVDIDAERRMDSGDLAVRLEQAGRSEEQEVVAVVATAGTTSTGAVDPLTEVADLCAEYGIWLHVDGAYGLAYRLVPERAERFAGVERADSVSWDPHKQFGVPIPSSLLFTRRPADLHRMALHADYFNRPDTPVPDPGIKSAPSTRPFTALPLVTSILHRGLTGVRASLGRPVAVMEDLHARLEAEPGTEPLHTPDTGIQCFRIVPAGVGEERLDELQTMVYRRVLAGGERSLAITRLGETTALRLVSVSEVVTPDDAWATVTAAREEAARIVREWEEAAG